MNKFLPSMINKNREKIQISNIKSQQMVLVTGTREILQIQIEYQGDFYTSIMKIQMNNFYRKNINCSFTLKKVGNPNKAKMKIKMRKGFTLKDIMVIWKIN